MKATEIKKTTEFWLNKVKGVKILNNAEIISQQILKISFVVFLDKSS